MPHMGALCPHPHTGSTGSAVPPHTGSTVPILGALCPHPHTGSTQMPHTGSTGSAGSTVPPHTGSTGRRRTGSTGSTGPYWEHWEHWDTPHWERWERWERCAAPYWISAPHAGSSGAASRRSAQNRAAPFPHSSFPPPLCGRRPGPTAPHSSPMAAPQQPIEPHSAPRRPTAAPWLPHSAPQRPTVPHSSLTAAP